MIAVAVVVAVVDAVCSLSETSDIPSVEGPDSLKLACIMVILPRQTLQLRWQFRSIQLT